MEDIVQSKLKIGKDLVHIFDKSVTRDEAINTLTTHLHENGYVKDSFGPAVLEREKVFPTGLPTEPVGVAIPHTDAEHVLTSALAVGILSHPVTFLEMGSEDATVDVHIISMMAISDPKSVMPVLKNLAMAYQDHDFLASLKNSSDQQMVLDLLERRIPDVIELV